MKKTGGNSDQEICILARYILWYYGYLVEQNVYVVFCRFVGENLELNSRFGFQEKKRPGWIWWWIIIWSLKKRGIFRFIRLPGGIQNITEPGYFGLQVNVMALFLQPDPITANYHSTDSKFVDFGCL